jgi:hypothetical protein
MTSPIRFPGADDAGGRDDVAGDSMGAMAAADARQAELERDTHAQGSTIGDLLDLPDVVSMHSKHTGGDDSGYPA